MKGRAVSRPACEVNTLWRPNCLGKIYFKTCTVSSSESLFWYRFRTSIAVSTGLFMDLCGTLTKTCQAGVDLPLGGQLRTGVEHASTKEYNTVWSLYRWHWCCFTCFRRELLFPGGSWRGSTLRTRAHHLCCCLFLYRVEIRQREA